jgi:hypothetical protein
MAMLKSHFKSNGSGSAVQLTNSCIRCFPVGGVESEPDDAALVTGD